MKELLALEPDVRILVRTDAPRFLFERESLPHCVLFPKRVDVGVLQDNSFVVKKKETLEAYHKLLSQQELDEETLFLKKEKPRLIVGDIPPLAFAAAAKNKIPSIALGNFSWDWILAPYAMEFPQHVFIVEEIRKAYSHANLLLRLPFHGDMSAFQKIKDVPLIARKAIRPRREILADLGLSPKEKRKIILFSFGKNDFAHISFTRSPELKNTLFISFQNPGGWKAENVLQIALDSPICFQDVVAASDAVVTKPGYGILSECLANRTPIVYTSRDDFVEYPILEAAIRESMPHQYISREDLFSGNWAAALEQLWQNRQPWKKIAVNGAQVAAKEIHQSATG